MRRQRIRAGSAALLVVVALGLGACATTLDKGIRAARLQKQIVEATAVEFAKLYFRGDPRITPRVYAEGRAAYQRYEVAQRAEAAALATWHVVKSESNETALIKAMALTEQQINLYLDLIGQFVDVAPARAKIGG